MTRAALIACLSLSGLVLAGCGGGGMALFDRKADDNQPRGIALETDAAGLQIIGAGGGRIDFGRAPSGVIPLLERELGPARELELANCPADITRQVAWGDLVLTFTDERFVGWRGANGAAGQTCGVMA